MQKVFDTYAQRKGIQATSLRFLLDGEKIGPDQTPKMLELDDQDQIDCMLEQVRIEKLQTSRGIGSHRSFSSFTFLFESLINVFYCVSSLFLYRLEVGR